jgi:hypothetical protein
MELIPTLLPQPVPRSRIGINKKMGGPGAAHFAFNSIPLRIYSRNSPFCND